MSDSFMSLMSLIALQGSEVVENDSPFTPPWILNVNSIVVASFVLSFICKVNTGKAKIGNYRTSKLWKRVCVWQTSPLHQNSRLGFSAVTSFRFFLIAPEKWNFTSIGFHCRLTVTLKWESWKLHQNCFRIYSALFKAGSQKCQWKHTTTPTSVKMRKPSPPLLSSLHSPLFQIELLTNSTVIKCDSEENKYV